MGLTGLLELLGDSPAYQGLLQDTQAGMGIAAAVPQAACPYLLAALWHRRRLPLLVIAPGPEDARRLHDQLTCYLGDEAPVYLFPEVEVLPFERLVADAAANNQRLEALAALSGPRGSAAGVDSPPPLVVTSTLAAVRSTIGPGDFAAACHTIEVGSRVRLSDLLPRWVELGYERDQGVEVPGTFGQRGGIVDVYPPSSTLPARIEFLGDQVDSIRMFDPSTQRSVGTVDRVSIIPAREVLPSLADRDRVSDLISQINLTRCTPEVAERFREEFEALYSNRRFDEMPLYNGLINTASLLDHLPQEGLLALVRYEEVKSQAQELEQRLEDLRSSREQRGELPANFPSPHIPWDRLEAALKERAALMVAGWAAGDDDMGFQAAPSYFGRAPQLAGDLRDGARGGRRTVLVSRHALRLSEILAEEGIAAAVLEGLESPPPPGSVSLVSGDLREGWHLPLEAGGITLLGDADIFGTVKERRRRSRGTVKREAFLSELIPGEYVVHIDHGVARFSGTTHMPSDDEQKEYLVLEYAEGDKIYVPTDHLDRVSPFRSPSDRPPSPTRLGTAEWSRVKDRAKSSAREMAQDLLQLYSSRQVVQGHSFAPDSPWQKEMEDPFPYEETPDQERTIREVKQDMEQPRPMDRLVCGDVGYGKTEVALRASFKTVNDGMQVGLLVPTTVLAQQHYATFSERLSPFPVRVEVLSRFRTRKEQEEVVEGLALGTVDIVIGTHRLLQKDVKFKNLGLVVVDEEQRFGVAHKEKLKRMRREVDILTLSATPIPRTLYMGLMGIRDMSTMETPPEERLPVKTYVSEYSDDVVKEAILRELDRGGQVFFLHNRISTIRRVAEHLRELVPQASVAIGHGRMGEGELEQAMLTFAKGDVDVLVCTTIIESGLDIPNANTLIVDRADRFGLSQLYQLRGRVGRGSHRAHSYLLVPKGRRITETAGKRLRAILEASELGAGFRIAMRDLEIRGAGNVLGAEQSGNIHAVGFELYAQLLNEAVAEAQVGQTDGASPDPELKVPTQVRVSLDLSAYIPEAYIPHLPTRLAVYQRLTRIPSRSDVGDIGEELRDRFGPLPQVVESLLYLVDLRLLAAEAGIESVVQQGPTITLSLKESVGGARMALEKALGPLCRVGNQQVHVKMRRGQDAWRGDLVRVLERLTAFKEQVQMAGVGA